MAAKVRLDVAAIRACLIDTQHNFKKINASLSVKKEPPSDEVIENLIAGYALIDAYIADDINLFSYGCSHHLLELNHTVLYEHAPITRSEEKSQFKATEKYFYNSSNGGVGQLMEWMHLHNHDSVWKQAAGVFTCMISQPQLFLEGNHRTGSLIMSYMLMRQGRTPFVLSAENAKFFFEPAELAKMRHKKRFIDDLIYLPKQTRKFAKLLKKEQHPEFLLRRGLMEVS